MDLLREEGLVKLEDYFLDGTKLEANANKYTFVWRKATERYDTSLNEKFRQITLSIEGITEEDERTEQEKDFDEKLQEADITSEKIEKTVKELEKRLKADPKNKAMKKAKRTLEKDLLPRKKKYEAQKALFNGRNSYSKTDTEATFMRMKEDHMRNGQLKPGYNVQAGTENQFVIGFSLHQRAGDPGCLPAHINLLEKYKRPMPKALIADAGYGSEENYSFCEEKNIEAFVKYNTFDKEQTKAWKAQVGKLENMEYDEDLDEWICANGKRIVFTGERRRKSENGYISTKRTYTCTECMGCPFQTSCAKGKETKTLSLSVQNQRQRENVRKRLESEEGKKKYSQRKIDVEPVFGQIKYNFGFNRLSLRGLSKNTVDLGLLFCAHNLKKWNTKRRNNKKIG